MPLFEKCLSSQRDRACGGPVPSYVLLSFYKNALRLLLPKRLWKWASIISLRIYNQKVMLLVIYLFNYDSLSQVPSWWIWHLMLFWARFLSNILEFIAIQRLQKHSSILSLCVLICTLYYIFMYHSILTSVSLNVWTTL